MSFADGLKWFENKAKKIEETFKSGKEGYAGITEKNKRDITATSVLTGELAQGLEDYKTKNNTVNDTVDKYLGMTANFGSNNYNVFVNTPMDYDQIIATPYAGGGCVRKNFLSSSGLTDASTTGFNNAYPGIFSNAQDAINACKIWAADSQPRTSSSTNPSKTYFAVSKDSTNATKFKCYYGNSITGTPTNYTQKVVAYQVANSMDANMGGLFYDGTVGVYNTNTSTTVISNPYNIQAVPLTALTGYSSCDKLKGGGINVNTVSATLGANCTNITSKTVPIRYIRVTSGGDYIQISQIVVLAFVNNVQTNVATRGTATSGNGSNVTNIGYDGTNVPRIAIDGTAAARQYPYGYHSPSNQRTEWWQVDLGQEYLVSEVIYYNRAGCCNDRARGMRMTFGNNNNAPVSVKDPDSGASTQTLTFKNADMTQRFMISPP
jgi:hypothetical protein